MSGNRLSDQVYRTMIQYRDLQWHNGNYTGIDAGGSLFVDFENGQRVSILVSIPMVRCLLWVGIEAGWFDTPYKGIDTPAKIGQVKYGLRFDKRIKG